MKGGKSRHQAILTEVCLAKVLSSRLSECLVFIGFKWSFMAEHKVARSTAYSPGWDARPSQSNHFPITSALETLYSGQSKLSTWSMKPIYLVVTPPIPNYVSFRNSLQWPI